MGRFQHLANRLSVIGAVALVIGSSLVAGVITQALTSSAFADTSPFEIFCPGTPVGNLVLNDVTVTGAMSPASPTQGQQFTLTGTQIQAQLPASVVQSASAIGLTSLDGTISSTVDAAGATPSSIPTGASAFDVPIPDPVTSSGVTIDVPSPALTVGPFTATSNNITLSVGTEIDVTFNDGAGIGTIDLHCSSYPNDILPSGLTDNVTFPPGLPASPVIATAGQATTPPPTASLTGPYELYCPHTPVGDLVLNDVVTTATVSPSNLSAGEQFSVTGYQTHIPLPAGLVSAAAGLGNSNFDGLAAGAVDAYGATPDRASTGSMSFDVPIPASVPSSGLGVDFPSAPTTVGPFTASGGPVTIAGDQSTLVVAALSSKAFKMSCTAYPNDSVATSGSTGTAPTAMPLRPIIATASASGSTSPPTTAPPTTVPPTSPTGPYELYCPGSPVGDLVLNDTTTTATITPSTLAQGQQFQLAGLQTQFSIPQSVVEQAEGLGLTQITGDASMFMDTTGVSDFGEPGPVTIVGSPGTSPTALPPTTTTTENLASPNPGGPIIPGPFPGGFPAFFDMPFNVTLPNPVPPTGVQFDAVAPADVVAGFTALGGPISFDINQVDLNVTEFGDNFGLFCTPFPNNSEPTGLTTTVPSPGPLSPVVATGEATITPPVPTEGPYELYCPNSPVGSFVINDVTTSGTLSPASPSAGDQFDVTGYQNNLTIPAPIVAAAAALGNTMISGSATAQITATGATTTTSSSGLLTFSVPIPTPVPPTGLALAVPTSPVTIGPFTASGGTITIAEGDQIALTLVASGSDVNIPFNLTCTTYANNSGPTGIVDVPPDGAPISPVIVSTGPITTPPPPTTIPPGQVTGAYELYCPGTPVGNIVLNDVTTTASIPSALAVGQSFEATNFQTQLNLPSSIASAAAALGNSSIQGHAVINVDAVGATPTTVSSGDININVTIPSPVPATGLTFDLPTTAGTIGPFTPTGGDVTLTIDPTISLTLVISGSDLSLACSPYPNDSAPTGITARAPGAAQASPVIATGSTSTSGCPPGAGCAVTATTTTLPSEPAPSSTTVPPTPDVSAIAQAFNTLFDPGSSIAEKVGVIENGSSIQTALTDAADSSFASNSTGVKVDDVTFPDDSGCADAGVDSPCAKVLYDILGASGTTLLPDNIGYAVSVNGTWLVSTATACNLLDLFWRTAGSPGLPPGCPAPTTIPPTTTAEVGSGTTDSVPGNASESSPDPTTIAANPPGSTTMGGATGAGSSHSSSGDPTTAPDPVVEASSGSLAFTGVGVIAQWLAVAGGVLIILGFVLLVMADTPRRLIYRLARHSPTGPRFG
ncbi:MAG TPA: DUF6801 domain-containing protein [Acidimicrobiales bacterium]|nr:DUF6801 domain-containing protein [Acidimicrobiales bacterium]